MPNNLARGGGSYCPRTLQKSRLKYRIASYVGGMSNGLTLARRSLPRKTKGWGYRVVAPQQFEMVEDVATHLLADGDVLVELTAGAVCGSDLPVARGSITPAGGPLQIGRPLHEVVGVVQESNNPDFNPGDRVVGWAGKEDALRQFFVTSGARIDHVRTTLSDPLATTAQSVACLMTVFERLGCIAGAKVAVVGLGPFGLMAGTIAASRGAESVVGIDTLDRTEDSAGLPFDHVLHTHSRTWTEQLTDAERPDVVLEMVGHQTTTLVDSMNAVARSGRVVAFGVPDDPHYALPLKEFFRRNGTLITGVTTEHRRMLVMAQEYLNLNPWFAPYFVTHTFGPQQVQDAFQAACLPRSGQRKIVIDFKG